MSARTFNRELLRTSILQTAAGAAPNGVTLAIVRMYVRAGGFRQVTEEELAVEVQYLVDKGLLVPMSKTISPENKAWRITAAGQDFLLRRDSLNMAKPRSDSKLLNLPPADQERIYTWLTEGVGDERSTNQRDVAEQIYLDFGIKTSNAALTEFWRRVVQPRRLRAAAIAAEAVAGVAREGHAFEEAAIAQVSQKAFEILAMDRPDPKEVIAFMGLTLEAKKLNLKAQELSARSEFTKVKIDQKERDMVLERKKFARTTCELFLKWYSDERAKSIVNSTGTNAGKIEQLGQALFEDWED